jgi:hypothetical protein
MPDAVSAEMLVQCYFSKCSIIVRSVQTCGSGTVCRKTGNHTLLKEGKVLLFTCTCTVLSQCSMWGNTGDRIVEPAKPMISITLTTMRPRNSECELIEEQLQQCVYSYCIKASVEVKTGVSIHGCVFCICTGSVLALL